MSPRRRGPYPGVALGVTARSDLPAELKTRVIVPGDPDWPEAPAASGDLPKPMEQESLNYEDAIPDLPIPESEDLE